MKIMQKARTAALKKSSAREMKVGRGEGGREKKQRSLKSKNAQGFRIKSGFCSVLFFKIKEKKIRQG